MAVYGRDFYGIAKYGSTATITASVEPFLAVPDGYGSASLSWRYPGGDWSGLRLIKSRQGYATHAEDGDFVLDTEAPVSTYHDHGLAGGTWYYYTLFLKRDGAWYRVGTTSLLALRNMGSTEILWSRIPRYFRWVPKGSFGASDSYYADAQIYDPASSFERDNQHLRRFIEILGWGVDYLRNHQETLLHANDPQTVSLVGLDRLAQQLGTTFEPSLPAKLGRNKVANATRLALRRGTVEMLQELASLDTGWDIDVFVGPNRMLNPDQAEFASPKYDDWKPSTRYLPGDRVVHLGQAWENIAESLGEEQSPPEFIEEFNTWWTLLSDADADTLLDPRTNGVSTWKAFREDGTQEEPKLAVGITSPVDAGSASNALKVENPDAVPHTYDVWGAASLADSGEVQPQAEQVIRQGIPMPIATGWTAEESYEEGDNVLFRGRRYLAIRESVGRQPDEYPEMWAQVGFDERPRMGLSFWAHGPFSGAEGTGGVPIVPGVAFFDVHGGLITDLVDSAPVEGFFYDTFNAEPDQPFEERAPEKTFANERWDVRSGNWTVWEDDGNVAWPLTVGSVAVVPAPTNTHYSVAATFSVNSVPGSTQALVLRYVDQDNFFRVTRTSVERKVDGVIETLAMLPEPVEDGDRVEVVVDDLTQMWNVKINGAFITTGSGILDTAAPFYHGLMVD